MTTGQRMKMRRKEINLSAERVAELLGVSPATVYRYENGDIEKVPGERLGLIAKVLQTTPAYLMGWESNTSSIVFPANADCKVLVDCRAVELTDEEISLIRKFRCLDDRGRAAVLNALNHEYESLPGEKANSASKKA